MKTNMITYLTGDILKSNTEALVNTVNLEGFMGKGIAYQFKMQFPQNFEAYTKACKTKEIGIGKIFVFQERGKIIFNFPTKDRWREKSKYEFIESGLLSLKEKMTEMKISSVSIPPLGCGNGGLDWFKVKDLIEKCFRKHHREVAIKVFSPSQYYKSKSSIEPKMTASHLVLMDLKLKMKKFNKIRLQKACFILNLFSGRDYFAFEESKFGPYSHPVELVAKQIAEYQDFFCIRTREAREKIMKNIISKKVEETIQSFESAISKTAKFVNRVEKDLDLETIATILWIVKNNSCENTDEIIKLFKLWPKEDPQRFSSETIEKNFHFLLTNGVIRKNLLNFEITKFDSEQSPWRGK